MLHKQADYTANGMRQVIQRDTDVQAYYMSSSGGLNVTTSKFTSRRFLNTNRNAVYGSHDINTSAALHSKTLSTWQSKLSGYPRGAINYHWAVSGGSLFLRRIENNSYPFLSIIPDSVHLSKGIPVSVSARAIPDINQQ